MVFTSENRPLLKPSHFAVSAIAGASIDPDTCLLFLRAYDVEALQHLLIQRGIPVTPVLPYTRLQGRAAKRHTWWRDTGACIPKALLLLCAITQALDPERRVPNPLHPSHPAYQPPPPRRMINGRPLAYSWDRALKRRPLPPPSPTIPVFPFRERDGSRFEPWDEVMGDCRTGATAAWLPRVVIDRLAECGAHFREQGVHGPDDPTGRFSHINRSAGVRRLLEAVRREQTDWPVGAVDLQAPLMFRGVELYAHPVTSWTGYEHYFRSAKVHLQNKSAPAVVPTGTIETTQSQSALTKPVRALLESQAAGQAKLRSGTLREFNTSLNLETGEFSTQIKEIAEQPKRARAPRRLRKDAVTEFNPDELG